MRKHLKTFTHKIKVIDPKKCNLATKENASHQPKKSSAK